MIQRWPPQTYISELLFHCRACARHRHLSCYCCDAACATISGVHWMDGCADTSGRCSKTFFSLSIEACVHIGHYYVDLSVEGCVLSGHFTCQMECVEIY